MEKVGESWRGGVPLPGRIPFGGKGVLPEKGRPSRSRNPLHPSLTSVVSRGWLQNGEVTRASQTDFGFWRFSTKSAELELRVEFSISLWRR